MNQSDEDNDNYTAHGPASASRSHLSSSTLLLSFADDRRRVPVPHVAGNELAQQPAAGPACRILWDVVVVQLRGDDGRVLLDIEAGIDADR
jgi:hypothetical protein